MPSEVRAAVEERLGAAVVEAETAETGFSPAVAARLRLADGRRAFVKGVGPDANPDSPGIYRAEARIAAGLPEGLPVPRLLDWFELDGWVVLLFAYVEGRHPAEPWRDDELRRVLDAVGELSAALTPAPVPAPSVAERFGEDFRGWRLLVAARDSGAALTGLDAWARRHLDALAGLESSWEEAARGDTLLHCDLRADNLLLTGGGSDGGAGGVVVLDWPWASVGADWVDPVLMLPSVRMQGGPPPERVAASHPLTRAADPAALTSVLAAVAGFFAERSLQPPPPGLPTLRAFQAAQGRAALDWLAERTGW
jgi:aminoglycoside phosphotransferase (APT) family kinase protein